MPYYGSTPPKNKHNQTCEPDRGDLYDQEADLSVFLPDMTPYWESMEDLGSFNSRVIELCHKYMYSNKSPLALLHDLEKVLETHPEGISLDNAEQVIDGLLAADNVKRYDLSTGNRSVTAGMVRAHFSGTPSGALRSLALMCFNKTERIYNQCSEARTLHQFKLGTLSDGRSCFFGTYAKTESISTGSYRLLLHYFLAPRERDETTNRVNRKQRDVRLAGSMLVAVAVLFKALDIPLGTIWHVDFMEGNFKEIHRLAQVGYRFI